MHQHRLRMRASPGSIHDPAGHAVVVKQALTAVLLANAAATLVMVGVIWFVQLVHYPLFALVGREGWRHYHAAHSMRTSWVVVAPMVVGLLTSAWLAIERGDGLAWAGLALALAEWALTFALAVPDHERLSVGWAPTAARRLVALNWLRTVAWSAHGAVVLALLASA